MNPTTTTYEPVVRARGTSGAVLVVDLTARRATVERIPGPVLEQFVGGRGIGLWLLWNAVTPATSWHAPENLLAFSAGPLAGVRSFSGSGKASVVTLSPLTGLPVDSSVGGNLGSCLAACGLDALVVRGVCDTDVVISVDGWTAAGVPTVETLARLRLDTPEILAVVRGAPS